MRADLDEASERLSYTVAERNALIGDLSRLLQACGDAIGAEPEDRGLACGFTLVAFYQKAQADLTLARAVLESAEPVGRDAAGRVGLAVDDAAWQAWQEAQR
jgi:hypothetical protein